MLHSGGMATRYIPLCSFVVLLVGCTDLSSSIAADQGSAPRDYWYHDANHPNQVVSPSPQAIYNATHGTWLWPPAEVDRPG